jgi:large subunit ribosomal protein L1
MAKLTKKQQAIAAKLDANRNYSIDEAVALLNEFASPKFKESIDVSINLGVDPRKSDQVVRGSTLLPNGTGKDVRVAVFAQGDNAAKAKDAGADIVGFDDLAESIAAGNLDFDVVIATPDAMRVVGKLGQVLGPRGLMPNPKVGTVTADVATAVKNAKAGQVRYRTDKKGIIHGAIGKIGFGADAIQGNLEALLADLKKAKPASSKGIYIQKVVLSSTMGPGVPIDHAAMKV